MIKPRGFTVLVLPKKVEDELKKKDSLIYIPETVLDGERVNIHEGTVVAIGNCAWKGLGDGEVWCEVGDRIIYAQFGGKIVKWEGTEYVLIQDKDVMAVIKETD